MSRPTRRRSSVELANNQTPDEVSLGLYTVEYAGTVPVSSTMGKEMCREAFDRMMDMRMSRSVLISITSRRLTLVDKKSGDLLKLIPIAAISFVCNPSTSRELCIVEQGGDHKLSVCHGFKLSNKNESYQITNSMKVGVALQQGKIIAAALEKQLQSQRRVTTRLVERIENAWKNRSERYPRGDEIRSYRCHFYGSALIDSNEEGVIDDMADKLFERGSSTAAELIIYESCLELVSAAGRQTFQLVHVGDISFAKQVADGVAYATTEKIGTKTYHTLSALELTRGDTRNKMLIETMDAARLGATVGSKQSADSAAKVTSGGDDSDFEDDPFGNLDAAEFEDSQDNEAVYLAPVPADRQEQISNDAEDRAARARAMLPIESEKDIQISRNPRRAFYLMPRAIGAGPSFSLIETFNSGSIRGDQVKKYGCSYSGSIQVFPPFQPPPLSEADVGKPVIVNGYGSGTLQFFGLHHEKQIPRAGVVLHKPEGKNNGIVKGHKYFMCRPKFGVLVDPEKVKLDTNLHSSWSATVQEAVMKLVNSKSVAQKASVVLEGKSIQIRSSDGKVCWYKCEANNVAYFAKFGEGKAMVFVALDAMDGHLYCHILTGKSQQQILPIFEGVGAAKKKAKVDGDYIPNFRATPNAAGDGVMYDYLASSQAQSNYYSAEIESVVNKRRRSKFFASVHDENEETDDSVGIFEAIFLGTETINNSKQVGKSRSEKRHSTEMAVKKILSIAEKELVFIKVGIEGIKVRAALSEETLSAFVIDDIRFTTVIPGWVKNGDIFAVLQKDKNLNVVHCHAYQCGVDRAKPIADAISAAFMHYQVRRSSDPFAAVGKRLAAPPTLFKRQVHRADLQAKQAIGAGQFGQVYAAMQTLESGETVERAVKMLRGAASEADRLEFIREAEIMLELDHANLVELVGVCVQQAPWLIVLEFLKYGDLRSILKACVTRGVKLTLREQLKWMVDIAAGMSFVESRGLIHMDLAARNCLLGSDNELKVADFGLAVKLSPSEDYHIVSASSRIPIKWCAPEALLNRQFSIKSDVWAAGVTFWEIFSYGTMPYGDVPVNQMGRKLREGTRLVIPRKIPSNIAMLVQSCWCMGKLDRPTFKQLHSELKSYYTIEPTNTAPRDIGAALNDKPVTEDEMSEKPATAVAIPDAGYEYGAGHQDNEYEYSAHMDSSTGSYQYEGVMVHNATDQNGDFQQVYREYEAADGDVVSFMTEAEHTGGSARRPTIPLFPMLDDFEDGGEGQEC